MLWVGIVNTGFHTLIGWRFYSTTVDILWPLAKTQQMSPYIKNSKRKDYEKVLILGPIKSPNHREDNSLYFFLHSSAENTDEDTIFSVLPVITPCFFNYPVLPSRPRGANTTFKTKINVCMVTNRKLKNSKWI